MHTQRYFQLLSEPNHPEDIQIPRPLGWALLPFCKWLRSPVSKMKVRTIERKAAVNLIHLFNPTHHPSHPAHRPWLLLVKYLLIREAIGSRQLCSRAPRHQHPANIFPGTKDVSFAPTLSTHNGAETTLGFFQNYSSASSDACVRNTLLKQLAVYKYISILASTAVTPAGGLLAYWGWLVSPVPPAQILIHRNSYPIQRSS